MKINIFELKIKMEKVLTLRGFSQETAKLIVQDYWEAEVRGKKSHGISKFIKEVPYFSDKENDPEIVMDKGSVLLIDAHREVGQISAQFATDLVIERARKFGIALVCLTNSQRYGALGTWTRKIAEKDLVGIVFNTCEPAAAPYGATSKVLGTNPISIGIPSVGLPIVVDMATSKVAMSLIWSCLLEKKRLPKKTFLDKCGLYTTNPNQAEAVEIFGDHKGFGLSIAIEILSGSLMAAKMGSKIKNYYDIGYYFQAIDPSVFQEIGVFKKDNNQLINEIKTSNRKMGVEEILIPGEKSERSRKKALKTGSIKLSELVWRKLCAI